MSETKACGACGIALERGAFSGNQWQRSARRRCKTCVAEGKPMQDAQPEACAEEHRQAEPVPKLRPKETEASKPTMSVEQASPPSWLRADRHAVFASARVAHSPRPTMR